MNDSILVKRLLKLVDSVINEEKNGVKILMVIYLIELTFPALIL